MMGAYEDYTQKARQIYQPQADQSQQSYAAALADKGLLGSTGAQGALNQNRNEWQARIRDWADQRYQTDRTFNEGVRQYNTTLGENERQFGVNSAMRIWEMIQANELARKGLSNAYTFQPVVQPKMFADIFKQRINPAPASGPVGDPTVDRGRGDVLPSTKIRFDTDTAVTEKRVAADADADRALSAKRFEWEKAVYKDAKDKDAQADDPWMNLASNIKENVVLGRTAPGTNEFPTDLLARWAGDFGIDVKATLNDPVDGPRLESLIRSMYADDAVADKVIARLRGGSAAVSSRAVRGGGAEAPTRGGGGFWDNYYNMLGADVVAEREGPGSSRAGRFGLYGNPVPYVGAAAKTAWDYMFKPSR